MTNRSFCRQKRTLRLVTFLLLKTVKPKSADNQTTAKLKGLEKAGCREETQQPAPQLEISSLPWQTSSAG